MTTYSNQSQARCLKVMMSTNFGVPRYSHYLLADKFSHLGDVLNADGDCNLVVTAKVTAALRRVPWIA